MGSSDTASETLSLIGQGINPTDELQGTYIDDEIVEVAEYIDDAWMDRIANENLREKRLKMSTSTIRKEENKQIRQCNAAYVLTTAFVTFLVLILAMLSRCECKSQSQ